jgi:hypothetical protein
MEKNPLSPTTIQPNITKGGLGAFNPTTVNPETPFVIFQYNPESLTRTISSLHSEEGAQSGINKVVERINLTFEFDVTDHLEHPDQHEVSVHYGLHPTLAALESMMHLQSKSENSNPSLILFLWSSKRFLLVELETMKVIEEAFDPELNPIRAKIELSMRVRDLSEFEFGSIGHSILASHILVRRLLTQLYEEREIYPDSGGGTIL